MNERIEEFYSQVGLDFENFQRVTVKKGDMEKFAELIVRECMDIAREVGTSTEPEDFALDRCYEIETKIKEHFGVDNA